MRARLLGFPLSVQKYNNKYIFSDTIFKHVGGNFKSTERRVQKQAVKTSKNAASFKLAPQLKCCKLTENIRFTADLSALTFQ